MNYTPTDHPLRNIPVDRRDYRCAREQAELLMQIALTTPQGKSDKPSPLAPERKAA